MRWRNKEEHTSQEHGMTENSIITVKHRAAIGDGYNHEEDLYTDETSHNDILQKRISVHWFDDVRE